jgi:hypothetical protein
MSIVKATELAGAGDYPSRRLNKRGRKIVQTSEQYAPANSSDWSVAPTTLSGALDTLAASNSGGKLKSVSAVYDFSVDGGAVSDIDLGVTLPDNAIIVECITDVLTPVAGSGTVQLTTATDGALMTGTIDSSDTAGPQNTTLSSPKKLTAARALRASIASNTVSAGKIEFFVRYYQGQ